MNNNFVPNNEHFLRRARNIRNELLNRTDKYLLSDYPISLEEQMKIKEYRQPAGRPPTFSLALPKVFSIYS